MGYKVIFLFIMAIIVVFIFYRGVEEFSGAVISEIERNDKFSVDKVIFKGEDGKEIYALFFKPKKEKFNVVIVLPAAEGTKESRRFYGEILNKMGYGALILDQRGIGETGGKVNNFQKDFESYLNGEEVFQYLMAKDVVSATDVLNDMNEVDKIGVLGESMGGRNAMIAAGIDKRIEIAVIISSAGYDISFSEARANDLLAYINPNSYIGRISPRMLLMLHSNNDNVISISDARESFSLASEPKRFVEFNESECVHGYCKPMLPFIEEELNAVFG